jgi:hypothetical protein
VDSNVWVRVVEVILATLIVDVGSALSVNIDRITQELSLGGVVLPKHDVLVFSMDG